MTKNYYDAVLIGTGLPTLLAGGLLAKRGFRVLLVPQNQPAPSYTIGDLSLPRAPFTLTGADSPAVHRVFSELALRPLMRRRLTGLNPAFQVVLPKHRLDFSQDPEHMSREIEREFPAVRRVADDFLRSTERAWQSINRLVERDLMWPPQGFLERRAHARASAHHPFGKDGSHGTPLGELPDDHALRKVAAAVLRFADGGAIGVGNSERQLRLFAGFLRGAALTEGGFPGLIELLQDSIHTHNGEVRLAERVDRITVRRGAVESIRLSPSDEEIGCRFVLSGLPVMRLGRLLTDRSELDTTLEEYGEPRPRYLRYTLNLVLRSEALPEGLARDLLLLVDPKGPIEGENALWVQSEDLGDGRAIMTVEALLPAHAKDTEPDYFGGLRERILSALDRLSPFLRMHLLLLDSPHDGRGFYDVATGEEHAHADAWSRGPDTMQVMYAFSRTRLHGCCALPVRTRIKRLYLCNEQVVPGLGLEGTFLTAWSAAGAVTRALSRDWMNRGRWTKVEL